MKPIQTVAPATTPVTLAECQRQCRAFDPNDDATIQNYLDAAVDYYQDVTGRQLITATWRLDLPGFPACIELPMPPLIAVSSITYLDDEGTTQTLSTDQYVVDAVNMPGRILPASGVSWPSTYEQWNAVRVTYTAGYGAATTDVPAKDRQAILWFVGHQFENREILLIGQSVARVPFAFDALSEVNRMVERF